MAKNGTSAEEERRARLAAALRQNLHRRKAQAKRRAEAEDEPEDWAEERDG